MAQQTRTTLKTYFETGDTPTQAQFIDLIDSSPNPTDDGTTGTGSYVRATSPTLVTPVLGVAAATSVNKVAFTAPATSATIVATDGTTTTLSGGTHSGTNSGDQTISLTGDVTGSGTGSFAATIANDAVTYAKMQNVSATDKVLGRSTAGSGDVEEIACTASGRAMIAAASAAAQTALLSDFVGDSGAGGTKGLVKAPATGDATKFLKGDGTWASIPGGGDALVANPLSQFAATTSLQLKGVMSDETGSGALVFADTPTLVTPVLGAATGTSLQLSGLTASEIVITDASKNLTSAAVATYPSLTELTYVKGVTSALQTQLDAKLPLAGGTMTGNITLGENTSIALDPAGSADGKYSGITVAGTAGEALAFGDVIVLDVTAGKWFKGSVSAAAAADGDLRGGVGMCVLAAAGDASATTVLLMGTCRADANFPALTIGSVVYATTSGDITTTRPSTTDHVIKILGFALTADEIMFNPSMDWMVNV